ncbi:MAG: hemin uptake protein HemP [Planctomycetota bacterium]
MNDSENVPDATNQSEDPGRPESSALIVDSDDLFQGRREIWIRHGSEMYRLRRTTAGKLYLSK